MDNHSPIGVFDSGLGGISEVYALHTLMPTEDILFFGDSRYNPYGTKTVEEITRRCLAICEHLQKKGCKAVVIACNTATSACVPLLRETFDMDIIGMEPALKVAADKLQAEKIAVWATELTLREEKFTRLLHQFSDTHEIRKVPCPRLVRLVEEDELDDREKVRAVLEEYIQASHPEDLDAIVLGCTHFLYFRPMLEELLPESVQIVDGNMGTARHVRDLLEQKHLLNDQGGSIIWENTLEEKIPQSQRLYERMEEFS